MNIRPISNDDVFLWPDGTWCMRQDASEYSHMSDDYLVLVSGSDEWEDFLC